MRDSVVRKELADEAQPKLAHSGGLKELGEVDDSQHDEQQQVYHARCRLQTDNRLIEVDVRPSDAFALAIACNAPILIDDAVLAQAGELGWTQRE